ncbi:hypothetical protein MNBD_GAMMA13-327 [hydrothermal vent metagenome]|uniref:Flagellar protein FliT n=1 Tax=hydrothermal vent metagenome TaxID=652676 RepID=A0A3B0XZ80_9ZZZZ
MDNQRLQQFQQIIAYSHDMLTLAQDNEWEQVAELDDKRRSLVMQCFQLATSDRDAPAVAAAIKEILLLNQQVADLGAQQQATLGGQIRAQQLGKTAKQAYSHCAR